jgi:hypothetical protein
VVILKLTEVDSIELNNELIPIEQSTFSNHKRIIQQFIQYLLVRVE